MAAGGTVLDPDVVARLLSRHAREEPLRALTPREREVLGLMAEGRSNAAIAAALFVTEKAIGKHTNSIFGKLGLPSPRTPTAASWRSWPTSIRTGRRSPTARPHRARWCGLRHGRPGPR